MARIRKGSPPCAFITHSVENLGRRVTAEFKSSHQVRDCFTEGGCEDALFDAQRRRS